jgi:hypothetical protein
MLTPELAAIGELPTTADGADRAMAGMLQCTLGDGSSEQSFNTQ